MDYRIEITAAEHGRDPGNGENVVAAFYSLDPPVEAVTDQNTETGDFTVAFVIEAEGADEAVKKGIPVFAACATAAGLKPTEVLAISAEVLEAEEEAETGEREPVLA